MKIIKNLRSIFLKNRCTECGKKLIVDQCLTYGCDKSFEKQRAFLIIEPHLNYINSCPELVWNLYDINLLPEQVRTIKQAQTLLKIMEEYKNGVIS